MPADQILHRTLLASGDDETIKYPEDHAATIYQNEVLGSVPFSAHMDSLPKEPAKDIYIHFDEEPYVRNRGPLTDVKTDPDLANSYVSGGVDGSEVFLKGKEKDLKRIINGNTLLVHDNDRNLFVDGIVMGKSFSGDDSYIVFKLHEDDTENVLASANLSYTINSQAQEEGDMLAESLMSDLIGNVNQTQIFSASYAITGSQQQRQQWYGQSEEDRQFRYMHKRTLMQLEMAYLTGSGRRDRGPKGKPRRRLMGVITEMKRRMALPSDDEKYLANRLYRFAYDADYAGKSWRHSGWEFVKKIMRETCFLDTGIREKDLYCGGTLWQGLADLLEDRTAYQWDVTKTEFGYNIKTIHGLQKSLNIWNHQGFNEDPAFQSFGFLTEKGLCKIRPYREMKELKGKYEDEDGNVFEDQKKAGLLYEGSMEWHGLENMGLIYFAPQNLL